MACSRILERGLRYRNRHDVPLVPASAGWPELAHASSPKPLTSMSTKPIATAPTDDEEHILHLWCPELGSWEAGVFFESDWRAHVNLDLVLKPSHWREPPPPPADSPDELPPQSQRAPDG